MANNQNKTSKGRSGADKTPTEALKSLYREPGSAKATRTTKIPLLSPEQKLSRSHDNLTGTPRKQNVPLSMAIGKKAIGKDHSPIIRGNTKTLVIPPMKKSISTQNFDKGSSIANIASRAQSVQNICRIPLPIGGRSGKTLLVHKRSSSAQNMINSGQRSARQPQSTAAAYNAELLSTFEKEKKSQERRISELIQISENRKAEVEKLKFEVKKKTEEMSDAVSSLRSENKKLREHLHEHGIATSHFTDTDKILLFEQISNENRSSVELSHDETVGSFRTASDGGEESLNLRRSSVGTSVGNLSSLTTQNLSFQSSDFSSLDRQNSVSVESGLSDLGLAYLRDRILQMQETNYSTNEELQATLQELTDLQDNVNELSMENEKLCDEKSILLESLCTQTEKLENARLQIEHLKTLLIQDSDSNDRSENELQLVALIRSAQEEREELLLKQAEFNNALTSFQNENRELQDIVSALRDRAELEESKSKVFQNDKRVMESQLFDMKNQNITDQLEIAKYKTLLENERQKSIKGESDCIPGSRNNCEESAKMVGRGADEEKPSCTEQKLMELKSELLKTKEINSRLNESLQTAQVDAETQLKRLDLKIEEMEMVKMEQLQKIELLEDDLRTSQLNHKLAVEEHRRQAAELCHTEAELASSRKDVEALKGSLDDQKKQSKNMEEEWLQLQRDLQVAVVIANDLKTETEYAMEDVSTENQILKEKLSAMTKDLNLLRNEREILKQREMELSSPSTLAASRLAVLRQGRLGSESSKPTELLVKKILGEERERSERMPPLSPSHNDMCSTRQEARPDSYKTAAVNSADNGVVIATDSTASPQLSTKADTLATGVSLMSSVGELRSSASDSDVVGSESSGDSPKKTLHGILSNKNAPRKGVFST